jgi:hemerythrin superfamily protein
VGHVFKSTTSRFNEPKSGHFNHSELLVKEQNFRNLKAKNKVRDLEEILEGKQFKEKIYKSNLSFETASLEYSEEIKKKLL